MTFDRKDLSNEQLLAFYRQLLWPRMIEDKMLVLLRQGKISKWFSGIGQEAIAVGATLALQPDEWIMPLHRNLGVFTTRQMPLHQLFLQWQGTQQGYSKARERSFHFGSKEHHICGMISHLGPQLAVADGAALAYKLAKKDKVSLAFTGDGGTSEGDFHEALNVAAVWDLPVIFLIENNGYGLSTPVQEQYRCERLIDKAAGYGMEGVRIDGNNILRGHEEASGTKYVPAELFTTWEQKDPIKNYERYLIEQGVLTSFDVADIKNEFKQKIEAELAIGLAPAPVIAVPESELKDVYAPRTEPLAVLTEDDQGRELRFVDAISEGLRQQLEKDSRLVLMGQDIAAYGGAFKITEGFVQQFGEQRIRNTPLCESAILGTALGLSLEGYPSMVEMQFADFVSVGLNQIVNNLAKIHYRWGQNANVVVRMPTGAGVGAGPFHSQSNEAWFTHIPGLKVVYPATPLDAKGLLIASLNDPNPVLFFEHKALYRSVTGLVPETYYEIEIGKAKQVLNGEEIIIITYGSGVHWAIDYAAAHPDYSIGILDLRTLLPLDTDAIKKAVRDTGRVLVLHEDTLTGGFGGEIAAWIAEHCFEWLDAPVMRCASLDTPVPFSTVLEKEFLATARLDASIQKLRSY